MSVMRVCVCVKASYTPPYADTQYIHIPTRSLYDHDPIAGGERATIAWAGICPRPAVEPTAKERLKKWFNWERDWWSWDEGKEIQADKHEEGLIQ